MEHRLTCAAGVAFYSIWDRMQGKVRISGQLFIVPVPYGLMSRGVPK